MAAGPDPEDMPGLLPRLRRLCDATLRAGINVDALSRLGPQDSGRLARQESRRSAGGSKLRKLVAVLV